MLIKKMKKIKKNKINIKILKIVLNYFSTIFLFVKHILILQIL